MLGIFEIFIYTEKYSIAIICFIIIIIIIIIYYKTILWVLSTWFIVLFDIFFKPMAWQP